MLVAQPFDRQASVPGATTDEEHAAPVEVTGTGFGGPCTGVPTTEVVDGISYESGRVCHPRWEMSDPRLDGTVTWTSSMGQDGTVGFGYQSHSIENAGGTWRQRPVAMFEFPGAAQANADYFIFDGDGDYEGLVAVLTLVDDTGSAADWRMNGFIIDGGFPPPPENASAK